MTDQVADEKENNRLLAEWCSGRPEAFLELWGKLHQKEFLPRATRWKQGALIIPTSAEELADLACDRLVKLRDPLFDNLSGLFNYYEYVLLQRRILPEKWRQFFKNGREMVSLDYLREQHHNELPHLARLLPMGKKKKSPFDLKNQQKRVLEKLLNQARQDAVSWTDETWKLVHLLMERPKPQLLKKLGQALHRQLERREETFWASGNWNKVLARFLETEPETWFRLRNQVSRGNNPAARHIFKCCSRFIQEKIEALPDLANKDRMILEGLPILSEIIEQGSFCPESWDSFEGMRFSAQRRVFLELVKRGFEIRRLRESIEKTNDWLASLGLTPDNILDFNSFFNQLERSNKKRCSIMEMFILGGYNLTEIGKIVGLKPSSVSDHVSKGVRLLKKVMSCE